MKTTITRADIESLLARSEIDVCTKFDKVTVVTVKLPNGFVLVEASGAVDKANYSEETGRKVCFERIAQKLWSFEGYQLSSAIAHGLVDKAEKLCGAIEQIPPGEAQTAASVKASELFSAIVNRC